MAVTFDLPGRYRLVIGIPFLSLIFNKFITKFLAQRLGDKRIIRKGIYCFEEVLGKKLDTTISPFFFR
jgi:hypothetical protein